MRGRRVFVSGGTGFLGAHLTQQLLRRGAQVTVLHRPGSRLSRLELAGVLPELELRQADLTDPDALGRVLGASQPEVVYHLAAHGVRAGDSELQTDVAVNVMGSFHLLNACRNAGVGRVVWMGSGFEYAGKDAPLDEAAPLAPVTWYGATKLAAWELARGLTRSGDPELVTVRLFSAFGPMEHPSRFIPFVITRALQREPIELTSGDQERDYLFVEDVAEALLLLGEAPNLGGEVFNLGSGEAMPIRALAERIVSLMGGGDLRLGTRARSREEADRLIADATKLRHLGWRPAISLEEGLRRTIGWYDENRAVWGSLP